MMVLTMTAGTVFVMWIGERITERGVGNGMSLLIFVSVAASFPAAATTIWRSSDGPRNTLFIIILLLAVIAAVVYVEQSQRRIPVQYAKRMVGRRMLGGSSTYIPLKINMAGVIPVIFASSLLMLPTVITQFAGDDPADWMVWLQTNLADPASPYHIGLYVLLIVFFAYFYTAITFNPNDVADNMKKYGGFIPGIRPGQPTADYLDYVLSRITAAGSLYLAIVALVPTIVFVSMGLSASIPFGGASILILVGVGLDTVKRIQSQLEQRHYEGFLK
jgi:preprotein translocase subunit SecY